MKQDKLSELLAPVVTDLGYRFWGLEYQVRKADALLRVYIDSPQGISVDDCATVSHEISGILDVEQPISLAYMLEVSSPGMDRILFNAQQFSEFVGQNVKVKLNQMVDKRRKIKGKILSVEDTQITIETDDGRIMIEFDKIMRARINPDFDGVKK
ncbi:Bacterial ribosome SSU maturation protein RimP [hydrothermal vent metagenome]|uniref:Bacterial ribosome SSU maturation protein RimP n=1 Tax=hydrothermal vent metagenome TaxID=652676 RepID=A0A3B0VH16_9ZZZZ